MGEEWTRVQQQIWESFADEEYRHIFVNEPIGLALQIRSMREARGWTQEELASRVGCKQSTVCQWENPDYGRFTLPSLRRLARVFDVVLEVAFISFSESVSISPRPLVVPSYEEEQPNHQEGEQG